MLLSQYGSWKPWGVGVLEAMLRPAEVDPHLKSYVDPHLWRYRSKTLCQFSSERLAMNRTWTSISRLQVLLIAKRLDENWRGVLGKGPATKFDEFSEKVPSGLQPLLSFSENYAAHFLSSPRAGPKGLRAESGRAVTGRRNSHRWEGGRLFEPSAGFFYGISCNSGTESRKIVSKVGN